MSLRLREGRAMSNFVSWSYNGEIEYGYAPDEKNRIGDYHLEGVEFDRKRSQVTNLRPAKVVEADAVSNESISRTRTKPTKGATMNQLLAWEYEGKTEFGYEISRGFEGIRRFVRVDNPHGRGLLRGERFITDLRKAKVVDEDAVQERISADVLWVHDGKEWRTRYAMWRGKPLKTKEDWDNYYLAMNPQVTEPKNFGAIVKWGTNEAFLNRESEWIHTETFHRYSWGKILRECHNPTIISEGVEG